MKFKRKKEKIEKEEKVWFELGIKSVRQQQSPTKGEFFFLFFFNSLGHLFLLLNNSWSPVPNVKKKQFLCGRGRYEIN
jgi:restriction endonuclease S subunit